MGRAIRRHLNPTRGCERIPLHASLLVRVAGGSLVAPLARCRDIGLGGLCATAAEGLTPGTEVEIEVRLPTGRWFHSRGRVAWCKTTLHPALLGSPRGSEDDATFGVVFESISTQDLLPIARLLVARDGEKRRARRIRRLHGLPIHA